jgi:hypothetical protein
MKKILLTCFFAIGITVVSYSQTSEKAILPFNESKILSQDDLSFIELLTFGAEHTKSRGSKSSDGVSVGGKKLVVGDQINKEQSDAINELIKTYTKNNNQAVIKDSKEIKSRGKNNYTCWYRYWDVYCGCYMIYYYYC